MLNPLFTGGGTFTLPTFKLPTVLRAWIVLVKNHLVNSYLCIDGVLRPFLGHIDAIHRVLDDFSKANSRHFWWLKKLCFLRFKGQKIILKPPVSPNNWSKITATCVCYNFRHFSAQLVIFEEFYSNFSDSNLRLWDLLILEISEISSWGH